MSWASIWHRRLHSNKTIIYQINGPSVWSEISNTTCVSTSTQKNLETPFYRLIWKSQVLQTLMKANTYNRTYPYLNKTNTVKKCEFSFLLQNKRILEKWTYLRVTSSNKSPILVCGRPYGQFVCSRLKNCWEHLRITADCTLFTFM